MSSRKKSHTVSRKSEKAESCGSRKSKNNPDALSKDELIKKVLKKTKKSSETNTPESKLKRMNMKQLCKILYGDKYIEKEIKFEGKRVCGPRRSKKEPNAYSKDELVEMALKDTDLTENTARRKNMAQLCEILGIGNGSVKKPKKSPVKKKSPIKKKSPVKKSPKKEVVPGDSKRTEPTKDEEDEEDSCSPCGEDDDICLAEDFKGMKALMKLPCISSSKLKLKSYQMRVVKHMLEHRGLISIHGTGSGKTLSAVTSGECLLESKLIKGVILAAPKSLLSNFEKESVKRGIKSKKKYSLYTIDKFYRKFGQMSPSALKKAFEDKLLVIDEAHNLRTEVKGRQGKKSSI